MKSRTAKTHHPQQRGAALITTLVLTALLVIFVLAYLVSMRLELSAASAYEQNQSAKILSQSAISHGISLLRTNIPEPARLEEDTGYAKAELWATNPGRLTIIEGKGQPRHVELHTGAVIESPEPGAKRDLYSVDLNRPLAGDDYPPITVALDDRGMPDPEADRPEMRVRWRNVLDDPSQPASKENQIVGRYAFWMDDESGKLNFNVAGGKPPIGEDDAPYMHEQLATGMMTPEFNLGTGKIWHAEGVNARRWALGQPRSINLDVLADSPNDLDHETLLEQAWLHGFSRYPEAIMDHVNVADPVEWYQHRKYNLTFYSRSPEFNAFGRSRFFSTHIPLSLESGPNYQLPFVYGAGLQRPEDGPLHLHALMSLGLRRDLEADVEDTELRAHNVVNQSQVEMLMGYMRRPWPGYKKSFVDKYGEKECYQIALSIALWTRIALARYSGGINARTIVWSQRTTSAIYAPPKDERPSNYPERVFWRFNIDGKEELMLPQTPGPHITEVRLKFQLVKAPGGAAGEYNVRFKYDSEYYMHAFAPPLLLRFFPTKVDYLHIKPQGESAWELGNTNADSEDKDRNWNHGASLGRLRATAGRRSQIKSANIFNPNKDAPKRNRLVVGSPNRFIGDEDELVPRNAKQARVFDLSDGEDLKLDFKIRLGMGTAINPRRPRQMIPMGDTDKDEHVLDGQVELNLFDAREQYVTFHIEDPRLSGMKDAWTREDKEEDAKGTLGQLNPDEPEEGSTEKSKFRFFSCGGGQIQSALNEDRSFRLQRGDEFTSFSVVSSKGYWSMLHTGIQSNAPWRTINLGPTSTQSSADPPDALLLNLFGATYPMQHDQWKIEAALPDEFSTVSFMNSTAGQVNLNTRVYPQSPYFEAPERKKPLEAVFKYLRDDDEVDQLVDEIIDYQTEDRFFSYIGELAEVDGYTRKKGYLKNEPTQFENEELLRNMAGCLTTNSNTFSLWGVAQVVRKQPQLPNGATPKYGEMELGDAVRSEKRFVAIIERYIWPGKDGVPGNGHVADDGTWDRVSTPPAVVARGQQIVDRLYNLPGSPPSRAPKGNGRLSLNNAHGTYPEFDGPEEVGMDPYTARALGKVVWKKSDLVDAYNPPQPVIKYRVVYFKYLDS